MTRHDAKTDENREEMARRDTRREKLHRCYTHWHRMYWEHCSATRASAATRRTLAPLLCSYSRPILGQLLAILVLLLTVPNSYRNSYKCLNIPIELLFLLKFSLNSFFKSNTSRNFSTKFFRTRSLHRRFTTKWIKVCNLNKYR